MPLKEVSRRYADNTRQWFGRLKNWFEQKVKRLIPQWYWKREIKTTEKHFERILEDAKQKGKWQDYGMAEQALDSEIEDAQLELSSLTSRDLLRRAQKVGVRLSDVALPKGETLHWRQGYRPGQSHLHYDSYNSLQKLVEDAEKQRRKERREHWESWSKILVSVLAAIASVIGVLIGLISMLKK